MNAFIKTSKCPTQLAVTQLAPDDQEFLRQKEEVIQCGLSSFLSTGRALLEIRHYRDGLLYKQEYGTFENYCRKRFLIGRSYSYSLMDAAEVFDDLSAQADKEKLTLPLPGNEKQLRHLKRLPTPELRLKAWRAVVDRARPGQPIRSETVAKAVREVTVQQALPIGPKNAKKASGRNHAMTVTACNKVPLEDIRGSRLDGFLRLTGVVYFKIGNFSIGEAIQILSCWKFSLKQVIAVIPRIPTATVPSEPVSFEPVLVGISKSVDVMGPTGNVVLSAEQIADWGERLPPEYVRYVGENTPGRHISRTLEDVIGLDEAQAKGRAAVADGGSRQVDHKPASVA